MQSDFDSNRVARNKSEVASRRNGRALVNVLCGLAVCSSITWFVVRTLRRPEGREAAVQVLVHEVQRADFVSIVTEAGDIESASNVEVLCEVKSEGQAGTTILEVVDEGAVVKKGEFLLQFDDSVLELALTQQEIQVATDQALVIQAQSELDKFRHMLNEYKDGLYLMVKETYESVLLQAESQLSSLQDALAHTRRMFKKGYVSKIQLDAEQQSVEMAKKATQAARTTLMVHNDFTRQRMISEYESEIEKQKALLKAAQYTLKLSEQRRDELKEQISYCRVVAPADGQVVYRNDYRRRPPVVIEEGAQIRQGQVIFRLPDPTQMQVDININDSKINLVSVGDQTDIELDSEPDLRIQGELVKIAPFGRRDWDRGPIRYDALVRVVNPPPSLRTGQRAKVHIYVERRDDVLQTPIQSVVGRDENHYCLVQEEAGKWAVRQVEVGPDNDGYVVVERGLEAGEQVALNPDLIWEDVAGKLSRDNENDDSSTETVATIGG
jgi:HlyD family secretion protein